MKSEIVSEEEGIQDMDVKGSSTLGIPLESGTEILGETLPSTAGSGVAFQISKEKFVEAAKACCGKLYPAEISDTIDTPDMGKIIYTLSLKDLEFDFLPKSPVKLLRSKNAIKITGSARGEMKPPYMKIKRVFFKIYGVAEPKISGDFVYLQFKEFGIEEFSPSGRTLSPQVINRIQAVLDPLFNKQMKKKIKSIKLGPTELMLHKGGTLKATIAGVKVRENALLFFAATAGEGATSYFEIGTRGNEIHISDDFLNNLFTSFWSAKELPEEITLYDEMDTYLGKIKIEIEIYRMRLHVGNGSLYVTGRITVKYLQWDLFSSKPPQQSFDFDVPICVSINPDTSECTFEVGEPELHPVKPLPGGVIEIIAALLGLTVHPYLGEAILLIYGILKYIVEQLEKLLKESIEGLEFPPKALVFPVPVPGTNVVCIFRCTEARMDENEIILLGKSDIIELPQRKTTG